MKKVSRPRKSEDREREDEDVPKWFKVLKSIAEEEF